MGKMRKLPKISKRTVEEIADRFEWGLDAIPALDGIEFYLKRNAAVNAAASVVAFFDFIREQEAAR